MHSRWFRIFMVVFITLWFGALLPGHTRGEIRVPGSDQSTAIGHSCCPAPQSDKSKHKQTDGSCCAVCFFVAGLLHYSPVTFDFAPRGQIEVLSIPLAHPAAAILPFQPYQSRAPPAFA